MDTSPDFSDKDTHPQLIKSYDGKTIILNKALGITMSPELFPDLKKYVGMDLITTDGTTLLLSLIHISSFRSFPCLSYDF